MVGVSASKKSPSRRRFLGLAAATIGGLPTLAWGQAAPRLRRYNTPFYVLQTNVEEDLAREAAVRMTAIAHEYSNRTSGFSGRTPRGMDFHLYADQQSYTLAGGTPGSAGVFQSRWRGDTFVDGRLMAFLQGDTFDARKETWRTIQHEGFHQFSAIAIGGRKPPWLEEGLADVFGHSEFTGDSFVSGVAPESEVKVLKAAIEGGQAVPFEQLMLLSHEAWNAAMSGALYLQSWSMAYFLLYGEGGRYLRPTEQFVGRIGQGQPWQAAFVDCFGQPAGFQDAWARWWTAQPADLSKLDYLAATLRKLTSFAARSELGGVQVETFDVLRSFNIAMPDAVWLPPGLLAEALEEADAHARSDGGTWSIEMREVPEPAFRRVGEVRPDRRPSVVYRAADGTAYRGTYDVSRREIESIDIAAEPAG